MSKRSSSARARKRANGLPAPRGTGSATPRKRERRSANAGISLAADCTLAQAQSLKEKLAALLTREGAVAVDVSGVRRIDTASLQLLAAFTRDRRASRLEVDVRGESAAFDEAVRLTGLGRLFGLAPRARLT